MARFRTRTKLALIGAALIPVIVGGFLMRARTTRSGGGQALLSQVMGLVSTRYVDTLPDSIVFAKAAAGMVRELNDPYSQLLNPPDTKQFNTRIGGRYGGLGMLIEDQRGAITITKVYPNTPGEAAGIREGDRIVKVDSLSTVGWTLAQVSDYVLGTPGTHVSMRFERPGIGSPIDVRFTRAIVKIPAVPFALMFDKVGYLPLQTFSENAAEETTAALRDLISAGATGIVLDLRGNPGGIVDQSVDIASLFLGAAQTIVSVRPRAGPSDEIRTRGTPIAPTVPMVVLIDPNSASAAEIVAGGLQDHDRALVVGQTSYGKGLVQTLYNVAGGYALKLTTAKWYTPSGRSIQRPRRFVNGRFVVDSSESAVSATAKRPAYRSEAGRIVFGGGGITPDVIVPNDTLSPAEQRFVSAVATRGQDYYVVLYGYALELARQLPADFHVLPAWRDELYNRLTAKGVVVDRQLFDSAHRYVDRALEQRVARFAFGDSSAKRRELPYDRPLEKAIDLLSLAHSQIQLFALVKK